MQTAPNHADFVRIASDAVIYRYRHTAELFRVLAGKLRLTCPFRWAAGPEGDPYENLLFQTKAIGQDGIPINTGGAGCKIYVQSWTTTPESDAMWRLNGAGDSVKIKTTAGALLQIAQNRFTSEDSVWFKIGAVAYLDDGKVADTFATAERFRAGLREPHESTMFKRAAYQHESEVRLVAFDYDDRNRRPELETANLRDYPENPFHLDISLGDKADSAWIEEVIINPRLKPDAASALADQIASRGIARSLIRQSTLYG